MYIDEQFNITNLRVIPKYENKELVVISVQWEIFLDDLVSQRISCNHCSYLPLPTETTIWTPFEQLTEEMVKNWIKTYDSKQLLSARNLAYSLMMSLNNYKVTEVKIN